MLFMSSKHPILAIQLIEPASVAWECAVVTGCFDPMAADFSVVWLMYEE